MTDTLVPHVPETAPFSTAQRAWLNGLFAGLYSSTAVDPSLAAVAPGEASAAVPVTILFGTQTGTAEQLAKQTARVLEETGLRPTVYDMLDYEVEALPDERHVLVLSSTHGEGDMPDNAELFWEALQREEMPRLEEVRFSVLGLGDTSYPDFCAAGKNFDHRFATLGAQRIAPRVDCDVDYEEAFQGWLDAVVAVLSDGAQGEEDRPASAERRSVPGPDEGSAENRVPALASVSTASSAVPAHASSGESSFPAPLLVNRRLTAEGSNKDTRHVEVSIEGASFSYEVGDALGVRPANGPELVDEVLSLLECTGKESVPGLGGMGAGMPLREALTHHYEIRIPSRAFLKKLARTSGHEVLERLLDRTARTELQDYLEGREVTDVLRDFPLAHRDPRAFVSLLGRLQPRLYSISSSPTVHANEVHLTVAPVRYAARGSRRKGVCSTFLSDRMYPGSRVPVYVQKNEHFSLPADGRVPLVMVGPGTGVAPFRAFLHERAATRARGRNWLFFGDRHAATDFLYKDELQALHEEGVLTRLDTAFSRDQEEKVYVQHRMREHAAELFSWLEEGAHFYVCGDADNMARDVDETLHWVIEEAGGFTEERASAYMRQMKKERRYQRDVY